MPMERRNPFVNMTSNQRRGFLIHMGDPAWLEELQTRGANARVELFLDRWTQEANAYQEQSKRYWLYQ